MSYHHTPVEEFHKVFGHPVAHIPTVPDQALRVLRVRLIAEELVELAEASGVNLRIDHEVHVNGSHSHSLDVWPTREDKCDMVEVADGLGDLRYVVDGANLVYGIPGEAVLREIHRSNMSKAGEDGKAIYREDGKILKGPNYTPPNIALVLKLHTPIKGD